MNCTLTYNQLKAMYERANRKVIAYFDLGMYSTAAEYERIGTRIFKAMCSKAYSETIADCERMAA